jgi:hypothetical protein
MIYLASPYSCKDSFAMTSRYRLALRATVDLMKRGELVFSPITYGHALETKAQTTFPYDYWLKWSRAMLSGSSKIYVLTIPGWEESLGVKEEVTLAHAMGKPVVGYAYGPDAEDICGIDILAAFNLALPRTRPDTTPRPDVAAD